MPSSSTEAATWVLFSCFAAYTGPFGTYSLSLGWRLVYWSLVVVISAAMASIFMRVSWGMIGPGRRLQRDLLTTLLMTLFFTPVLIWLSSRFMTADFSSLTDAYYFAQYVAIITLGVVSGRRVLPGILGARRGGKAVEEVSDEEVPVAEAVSEAEPEPSPQPRLMRRLPEGFAGPILRLTSEDHFVDVVAAGETVRLRLRLADAIDEMDPVEGVCTHRSHWVVRDAIDGVEREGGRILLRLSNGDLVPVSRTYRPRLEEAGIL